MIQEKLIKAHLISRSLQHIPFINNLLSIGQLTTTIFSSNGHLKSQLMQELCFSSQQSSQCRPTTYCSQCFMMQIISNSLLPSINHCQTRHPEGQRLNCYFHSHQRNHQQHFPSQICALQLWHQLFLNSNFVSPVLQVSQPQ